MKMAVFFDAVWARLGLYIVELTLPELRQHLNDGVHDGLPAPEGVGRHLPVLAPHVVDVGKLELRYRLTFGDRRGVDVLDHPRRLLVAEVLQVGEMLDDLHKKGEHKVGLILGSLGFHQLLSEFFPIPIGPSTCPIWQTVEQGKSSQPRCPVHRHMEDPRPTSATSF